MATNPFPPAATASTVVTVRGLAPALKARLRVRAAHNARSMEAEARAILEAALAAPEEDTTDLASFARGLFAPLGGVELELPPREPARDPPGFGHEESVTSTPGAPASSTPAPGTARARTGSGKTAAAGKVHRG